MTTLALPITIMLLVSIMAGIIGWRIAADRRSAIALAIAAVGVLLIWGVWLADNLLLVQWVPLADALVWLNPQPLAAAVLAGVAWRWLPGPRWQRLVLVVPLALLGPWRAYGHLAGSVPHLQPHRMSGPVVRQSTTSTCSAAAAATALRQVGIDATERQMAAWCLTRVAGTTQLGLWRGLKRATAGSAVKPIIFHGPLEGLIAQARGPAVLSITGQRAGLLPLPGNRHTIVLLGVQEDGMLDIADPFSGRQTWPPSQLAETWTGQAIVLQPAVRQ